MSDGSNFNELQYEVQNNSQISLSNDVVLGGLLEKFNFNNGIEIKSDNLIIDGNGHTIDAKGKVRIFNISGKNITLKNINFKNGFDKRYGGAIRNAGSCNIINCTFESNFAEMGGDDISNGSEMCISNCKFSHIGSIHNVGSLYAFEDEAEDMNQIVSDGNVLIKKHLLDISFNVINDDNNPLEGAVISIDGKTATTNENGDCTVKGVMEGFNEIKVSADGYNDFLDTISVSSDKTDFSDVPLKLIPHDNNFPMRPFEAYRGDEPYVFVSYGHADAEVVFNELKRFNDMGINIWYDEGISSGAGWQKHVENTIINSSLFIVFLSQNAVDSQDVRQEIFLSLSQEIPIIPIFLESAELKYGLRMHLASTPSILKYEMPEDSYVKQCITSFKQYGFDV